MKRMLTLAEEIFDRGIPYCTLFALSAENLSRPEEELEGLFSLFRSYFTTHYKKLLERGIAMRIIGDRGCLPQDIVELIERAERETAAGTRGTLAIAIGYGGRQDIVNACNRAVREGREVTMETFARTLSTGGMPELDLLIRTGKEKRISNFLLFEAAYAELYFSEKLFPDFTVRDLSRALADYAGRERRYGKI